MRSFHWHTETNSYLLWETIFKFSGIFWGVVKDIIKTNYTNIYFIIFIVLKTKIMNTQHSALPDYFTIFSIIYFLEVVNFYCIRVGGNTM